MVGTIQIEGMALGEKSVTLRYFSILRDEAGCSEEVINTTVTTLKALYEEQRERHGWTLSLTHVKVAVNGGFGRMSDAFGDGDEIVFLPPSAGG